MPISGSAPSKTYTRSVATFTGSDAWQQVQGSGRKILSVDQDEEGNDHASALNAMLMKDGGNFAADIPANGFKFTGIGNASARTHFAAAAQVQDGTFVYATVGGTADAITLDLTPSITAYAAGQTFKFVATGTNTGAVTLNVDGVGDKSVLKGNAGDTALTAGDITTGGMYTVSYDGTAFQLAESVRGTVSIANGGTGATSAATAWAALRQTASETVEGAVEMATEAEIYSATTGAKAIMAQDLETASNLVTLTETAGAVAVNWDTFINGIVTIDENTVISNPTNGQVGTWRTIIVVGNNSTDRTITFGNQFFGEIPTIADCDSDRRYLLMIYCWGTTTFAVSAKRISG
jgi:hypothetical protein